MEILAFFKVVEHTYIYIFIHRSIICTSQIESWSICL